MTDPTGTVEEENARRARLYDALWQLAYEKGMVTLDVTGTHDTVYRIWVGENEAQSGELADIEQWITAGQDD